MRETGIDDVLVAAATKGGSCPLTDEDLCALAPAEGGERRDGEDAEPQAHEKEPEVEPTGLPWEHRREGETT